MSQGYFVVRMSEDGDVSVDGPLAEANLLRRITPKEDGWTEYGPDCGFAERVPDDLNNLDGRLLIIKGEVVVPRAVQKVTEYKLP